MKILHVAHSYYPEGAGGVETYLKVLLASHRDAGHDVTLLAGSVAPWPEVGVEETEVDGARVLRVHRNDLYFDHFAKIYHPGIETLLGEILSAEKPDVIHIHQWIRLTCNLVEIAEAHGIPAVVTLHDLYVSCPRCFRVNPKDQSCELPLTVESCLDCVPRFGHESEPELRNSIALYRDQYQGEISSARAVMIASQATADAISQATGFDVNRFELLPLAYQQRFEGAGPVAELPADDQPFKFGYWGNLTYRKGAQLLVEAFAEMMRAGAPRPVELHLFGNVDSEALGAQLQALAKGLPVTFHGRYEYEQIVDIGLHMAVFPMLCFETYGFVLDECFELGLPCIVTDIGAMPVRAGAAAIRVPPGNRVAMTEAMRGVLERPVLRDELMVNLPAPSPTPEEHRVMLDSVYKRVIDEGPSAPQFVSTARRAELLLLQRESAQSRVCPEGGPQ